MKNILGFLNYAVTPEGTVINTEKNTERKLDFNKSVGYFQVDLYRNNKRTKHYVHRLVATAFVPNPHGLPEVNHKDSDRTNNNATNLEWVTSAGNSIHAVQSGQRDHVARMSKSSIEEAFKLVMQGLSYKQVAEHLDNSWMPGFLSVKVGQYAKSVGLISELKAELKRQRIVRSIKNLESVNSI